MLLERQAYSVADFCAAYDTSRAALYRMWQNGQGPAYYNCGGRRLISREAAIAWQRPLEATAPVPIRRPPPSTPPLSAVNPSRV
jgi:hypothetical protein